MLSLTGLLTLPLWSPYIAGAGIGVLAWLSFLVSDRPMGCSTSYVKTAGMLLSRVYPSHVEKNEYYQKYTPKIDWSWLIVIGIIIGAFISSSLSGTFAISWVPPLFASTFSDSAVIRWVIALVGGIFLGFGARWAGGCTSGHGISGSMQLSLTSMVTSAFFFVGGIATAMVTFALFG
ncbi:YeeE/YedE thiosulfate transporter family protein [Methanogenium marinum]|uniref:YeeE/YedE thiosulfate transporter family protein n=1 Tax=Methanogenium marinum TaxID=348610 RepID=UPI003B848865